MSRMDNKADTDALQPPAKHTTGPLAGIPREDLIDQIRILSEINATLLSELRIIRDCTLETTTRAVATNAIAKANEWPE